MKLHQDDLAEIAVKKILRFPLTMSHKKKYLTGLFNKDSYNGLL